MLTVEKLTKRYGKKKAVDGMSFELGEGTAVGFVGPNGAGKSTAMNMITGYLEATSGTARLNGKNLRDDPVGYKRLLGYLPEIPPLYLDMTICEYLDFVCEIKLDKGADIAKERNRVMKLTGLSDVCGRLIRNMSKGFKQRIGLAQAIIGTPELIVLDEPTIGLDPSQVVEFRNLLYELKKSHTILLSSHILSEITEICDEIVMINEGKIIAKGSAQELIKKASPAVLKGTLETDASLKTVEEALRHAEGAISVKKTGNTDGVGRYLFEYQNGAEVKRALVDALVSGGFGVYGISGRPINLEDVFMTLTSGKKRKSK